MPPGAAKLLKRFALLVSALLGAAAAAAAGEVSVAVAANFAAPMQKIGAAFKQDTGHRAALVVGSTGKFYAQIKNGAPFQVLLAADAATPARLVQEGLGVASSRSTYASGRLALWSRDATRVDAAGQVLRSADFARLALADPKLSPYGAAAQQVLQALALAAPLAPTFVQGENIAQTHQFVATGNAELGFVALSQVFFDGRITSGSAWVVPAHLHQPLRQDALLLNSGKNSAAGAALLAYLRSDKARAIMRAYGYDH